MDQCQQFVLFERSARQAIEWIQDTGEKYLAARRAAVAHAGATDGEKLIKEQAEFRGTARESRERVKLLTQLADGLVDKGHAHAVHIKQWVAAVDARLELIFFAYYISM